MSSDSDEEKVTPPLVTMDKGRVKYLYNRRRHHGSPRGDSSMKISKSECKALIVTGILLILVISLVSLGLHVNNFVVQQQTRKPSDGITHEEQIEIVLYAVKQIKDKQQDIHSIISQIKTGATAHEQIEAHLQSIKLKIAGLDAQLGEVDDSLGHLEYIVGQHDNHGHDDTRSIDRVTAARTSHEAQKIRQYAPYLDDSSEESEKSYSVKDDSDPKEPKKHASTGNDILNDPRTWVFDNQEVADVIYASDIPGITEEGMANFVPVDDNLVNSFGRADSSDSPSPVEESPDG